MATDVLNLAPVVVNEYVTVNAGQLVSAPASILLTNDLDPEGGALSIVKFGQASHGTFTQSADGTISYVSAPGFVGQDTVTYVVQDAAGNQTTGTIYLNVVSTANVPPTLQDEYATVQAGNAVTADPSVLLANDGDANGDKLTIVGFGKPTVGTLVQNADGTITYTAPPDYSGPATFTYTVSDGKGGESTATVYLTVAGAPNAAPIASDDAASVAHAGSVTINVLANDTDANGDKLTVTGVNQPANGSAVLNADGTVTYKANAGYNGTDTFTYTVADGKGGTSTATVAVQVAAAPNVAPVASDDAANVAHAGSVTINVLANDTDANGDKLTVTGINQPANGSAVLNADGTVTYKANAGYSGTDTFTYTVADGKGGTSTATVAVKVAPKVVDLSAPDLAASSDSGFSNVDNYTNATRPSFVIGAMAKAGDVPNLYVNGVKVASTYDAATGSITPVNAIAAGNQQVSYSYTNAAGIESAKSAALSMTIDTTAPTVAAPDLMAASDWGTSNTDNLTSDNTPSFFVKGGESQIVLPNNGGVAVLRDKVTLLVDGVEVASSYNGDTGELTPLAPIADGAHVITAKLTDAAGNASAASAGLTVNINTAIPAASVNTPDLLTTADTGASNVDNITANTRPVFVVGEKIPGGDILLLVDGVQVAATYDAVAKTLTPTVALSEGLHQISMVNVSPSGVKSTASPALTIDVDAVKETPTNGADMVAASDSGLSQTDNITNNTRPSFAVGAPPKAGDVMNLYIDNKKVDAVYDEAAGTLTPVTPLPPGQHWVAWSVTNAAGVESGLAAIGDRAGLNANYFNGTSASGTSLLARVDSNVNFSWGTGAPVAGMSDAFSAAWTGKLVTPTTGSHVFQVSSDDGIRLWIDGKQLINHWIWEAGVRTSAPIVLEAGKEHDIRVEFADFGGAANIDLRWQQPGQTTFTTIPAGNGQVGLFAYAGDAFTIDTAAPTANKPDMLAVSDRGTSSVDDLTSDNRPIFNVGTVADTDRVTLWVDGKEVAATYDAAKGTVQSVGAIADGAHSVSLKVTDLAGNVSAASAELSVRIDTRTPSAPVNQPDMLNADDTGISNTDNITANTQPRFIVGEVPPNGKIELLVDGQVVAGTYDTVGKTIKPAAPLAEGTHEVSMRYVSESGVASAASPALAIEIDAIADPVADRRATLNLVAFEETQPVDPTFAIAALPDVGGHVVQTYSLAAPISANNTSVSLSSISDIDRGDHSLDLRDLMVMDTALFATNSTAEAQANADVSGTSMLASADTGSVALMGLVGDLGSFTGLFREADQATYQQF